MIELNQKYRVRPAFTVTKDGEKPRSIEGKVVYIHPRGRYATLEFTDGTGNKARECFGLEQLTPDNLVREKKGRHRC